MAETPWPKYDPALTASDSVTIAIQVNGKRRGEISMAKDAQAKDVEAAALGGRRRQARAGRQVAKESDRGAQPDSEHRRMKKPAALVLCLVLAACGFHPMYGSSSGPAMSSVFVEPIAERDGFELRTALIDYLQSDGEERGKAYHLKIVLGEAPQGIALQNDATITRYNNTLTAHYTLYGCAGQGVDQRHPDPDVGL